MKHHTKPTRAEIKKKFDNAVTMPEPYGTIADDVMDRDRAYFEQHPKARSYIRKYIWGEAWPNAAPPAGTLTRVHQIQPGVRYRELLIPDGGGR